MLQQNNRLSSFFICLLLLELPRWVPHRLFVGELCATWRRFLHGIRCGIDERRLSSASCDRCRWFFGGEPFHSIESCVSWPREIHRQRNGAFASGTMNDRIGGTACVFCSFVYRTTVYPSSLLRRRNPTDLLVSCNKLSLSFSLSIISAKRLWE